MAIGDIINAKRVRTQANERLDTVDIESFSQAFRNHLDMLARAALSPPQAAGGSSPTGMIIQGFGLTLNPINGTDGKVRVGSGVGVAFDANGRLLIKENGVTIDTVIPSGTVQLYAYYVEDATDLVTKRFISVTSPYSESGSAINTSLKGDVGIWVRTGNQSSIVASDVVNGQTTPLCFLGVVTNTGGAITCTGYDATNAPNGVYATNRLSAIAAPASLPVTPYKNGSITHPQNMSTASAYLRGLGSWKGGGSQTTIGSQLVAYSGTSTSVSGTPATLNDTTKSFVVNELVGGWLKDSGGVFWPITSNTATAIVSSGAGPAWWWNATSGSNTIPNGPPAAGAYTVYQPVASNNYGAWTAPNSSVQELYDWLSQYNAFPHTWAQSQTAPEWKTSSPRSLVMPASMGYKGIGSSQALAQESTYGVVYQWLFSGAEHDTIVWPILLHGTIVANAIAVSVNKSSDANRHIRAAIIKVTSTGSASQLNGSWDIDNNTNNPGNVVLVSGAFATAFDASSSYYIVVDNSGGLNFSGDVIRTVRLDYTQG